MANVNRKLIATPTGYEYREYKNWRGIPKVCKLCRKPSAKFVKAHAEIARSFFHDFRGSDANSVLVNVSGKGKLARRIQAGMFGDLLYRRFGVHQFVRFPSIKSSIWEFTKLLSLNGYLTARHCDLANIRLPYCFWITIIWVKAFK
jgi:hypothetical protein